MRQRESRGHRPIRVRPLSSGHCDTDPVPASKVHLTEMERALVLRALRHPRGRYVAERASQLSAIPVRTLHDWATSGSLVPDWMAARPRGWSYRDVVYARLLGWLRSKQMERSEAVKRVALVRHRLADSGVDPAVRSDGTIFLVGEDDVDRFTGQQVFDGLADLLDVFELTEPIEGVSSERLWGPSLVHPSRHTFISPWVVAGEPCVLDSRIPSASLHALSVDRGLSAWSIQRLYPFLSVDAIEDAVKLEKRLRSGLRAAA
jgi:uncharacterized protein (DUF433 family)